MAYDAIVVGGRCAGAATAMLMARQGLDVLVVDRATFPSDTRSTHCIHAPGVAMIERWGLAERLEATGAPRVHALTLASAVGTMEVPVVAPGEPGSGWAPRRYVLDDLLVTAAREAGAEVREAVTFDDVTRDADGRVTGIVGRDATGGEVREEAAVVIGADGYRSAVAAAVEAPVYDAVAPADCAYYGYWKGFGAGTFECYLAPPDVVLVFPTNDDSSCIAFIRPLSAWPSFRDDPDGEIGRMAEAFGFADRLAASTRTERLHGVNDIPGFFRQPWGPGWALVGDAGHCKDPITGHGITDAFRDAETLADAVVAWRRGDATEADALAGYHRRRDALTRDIFDVTNEIAKLEPDLGTALGLWGRYGSLLAQEAAEVRSWPAPVAVST